MNVKKAWIPFAALVLALASPGRAQEQDEPAPAPAQLSKGDGMLIHIAGVGGDLPTYREIVDSQGNIDLPFLGRWQPKENPSPRWKLKSRRPMPMPSWAPPPP